MGYFDDAKAFGPTDMTDTDFVGTISRLEKEVIQLKQDKLFLQRRNEQLEKELKLVKNKLWRYTEYHE